MLARAPAPAAEVARTFHERSVDVEGEQCEGARERRRGGGRSGDGILQLVAAKEETALCAERCSLRAHISPPRSTAIMTLCAASAAPGVCQRDLGALCEESASCEDAGTRRSRRVGADATPPQSGAAVVRPTSGSLNLRWQRCDGFPGTDFRVAYN